MTDNHLKPGQAQARLPLSHVLGVGSVCRSGKGLSRAAVAR